MDGYQDRAVWGKCQETDRQCNFSGEDNPPGWVIKEGRGKVSITNCVSDHAVPSGCIQWILAKWIVERRNIGSATLRKFVGRQNSGFGISNPRVWPSTSPPLLNCLSEFSLCLSFKSDYICSKCYSHGSWGKQKQKLSFRYHSDSQSISL